METDGRYFDKHRLGTGDIANHVVIADIVVTEELRLDGFEEPYGYICEVHMEWLGHEGDVYVFPDWETAEPDDEDGARDFVVRQLN